MRKVLLATAAVLLAGVGSAAAEDTSTTYITANQPASCVINAGNVQNVDLGNVVNVPAPALTFNYQCNFLAGGADIHIHSDNGGVLTDDNGTYTADYGVYLNDVAPGGPPSTWDKASTMDGPGADYPNLLHWTGVNNPTAAYFYVGLVEALPVAGDYDDVLTVTISP